jgi:hypothetical protein
MAIKKIQIIPPGYTDILHPETQADIVTIADAGGLITATTVEGALQELFTNANNGKTAIANAVNAKGISATSADTFSVLATKIATTSLVNTADATVVASEMISGKAGYKNGAKIIGTMPFPQGWQPPLWISGSPTSLAVALHKGYYAESEGNGTGSWGAMLTDANFIASNILSGKSIFGLAGSAPNVTNDASVPSGGYDGDYWIQP